MKNRNNDIEDTGRFTPKVETMRPDQFAQACESLAAMVRSEFGQWQLVVGIASGGLHRLPWFVSEGVGVVSVGMSRRTTAQKQGLVSKVLSKMPEKVCDFLRKTESRIYDFMNRGNKENREEEPTSPPEGALQLELYLKLWRLGQGVDSSSGEEAPRILIVDDAADSGSTLRKVKAFIADRLPDARIATAVLTATRRSGSESADFALYRNGTLLRFPWAPDYRRLPGEEPLPTMRTQCVPCAENGMTICDLDGTLIDTNSFSRFVAWIPRVAPWLTLRLMWIVASRKLRCISHAQAKQRILDLVEGYIDKDCLEDWCATLLKEHGRDWIIDALHHYQQQGAPAVLATAAPSLYASVIARLCGLDYCLSTERGGEECVGELKLARVSRLLEEEEARPILFFSDHADDLPLARWCAGRGGSVVWCQKRSMD